MLTDLTDREVALVDAARAGSVLQCGDHDVDVLARSADPIRAGLIRELLLGRHGELDPRGVQVHGARIVGALELDHVTAVVGLVLVGCVIDERVDLSRAVLPRLVLTGSRIAGIQADGVRVAGDLVLGKAQISGSGAMGAICLRGAVVEGALDMKETEVHNESGPALDASDLEVGRGMLLERAVLSGAGEEGAICLVSARVGDDLYMVGTKVRNDSGAAIYADGLHVEDALVLLGARVSGTGDGGAIWLLGAHLGGLRVVSTKVANDSGPALFADQLQVRGLIHLERLQMSGTGDRAAVRLAVAQVGGQFTLIEVAVTNPSGLLLDLHETHVAGGAHFPADVICRDQTACGNTTIDLNDFTYASLAQVDWRQWLHVIRCHTKEYHPSPYQRLAAVERAAGHDSNARQILIAQQHDLRHRAPAALGGWLTRRFHWLWGALAGYGYRARRTALALLVALAAASLISLWAGHVTTGPGRHAAEHTVTSGSPRTPCSIVELVGLGLDRGLPLGPTGLRARCDLDTESTAGQLFTVLLWVVQAAVWGLATLAIAGYTGLIRKTT